MTTIGVQELHEDTGAILRRVREQGKTLDVTDQGEVVARLVPVAPPPVELDADLYRRVRDRVVELEDLHSDRPLTAPERAKLEADLDALDALAVQIGVAWKDTMSAADAVKEQRRDL